MPDVIGWMDKLNDADEMTRAFKLLPKVADDLNDISKGPLDEVMGPIGTGLDLISLGSGAKSLYDGATGDTGHEDLAIVDGIHDVLDGGLGLGGHLPGQMGWLAKAASAGFTVGDMIAPYVYNDAQYEGERMVEVPEDGEFHAETGNESVDEVLEGVRDIADGDYLDGALDIADGATGIASGFVPGLGAVEGVKDMYEYFSGE